MKKKTLNLLILNLVITAGVWSIYFYMIQHVKTTSTSLDDIKHKISFAMKKEQAINNLRSKIQANFKEGFDLNSFVIHPDQTADVVQTIEGFGSLTRTKITTQSVATEEAIGLPEGVDFLKIVFSIEGTRQNVLKGILLIENLPYNTRINKLGFTKSGDASSTARWIANVDLSLVKLKESHATSTSRASVDSARHDFAKS